MNLLFIHTVTVHAIYSVLLQLSHTSVAATMNIQYRDLEQQMINSAYIHLNTTIYYQSAAENGKCTEIHCI